MIKKHIPNFITCLNLFSGCVGSVFAFQGDLKTAAYLVILAAVFDFLDGNAARLLNSKSPIGKDLDSLADMVSFGFLPGLVMYQLLLTSTIPTALEPLKEYLPYFGFIITLFSALRLAKFNVDTRQSVDFIGLNTPTNTLFIAYLPFIKDSFPTLIENTVLLLFLTLITSSLLVSEIRLFSLKIRETSWEKSKYRYLFAAFSLVAFLIFQFAGIPLMLLFYLFFSFLHFRNSPKAEN